MALQPAAAVLAALVSVSGLEIPASPPTPQDSPAIPTDLIEAGKRWGHSRQAELLPTGTPGSTEHFTFEVIGDVEPGRFPWERIFAPAGAFRKLMAAIHSRKPHLIVQLGDFVSKGTPENYREYIAALMENVSLPLLTVIGNHDRPQPNDNSGDKTLYRSVFGTTDFYYDYNGSRFIGLDSSDRKVTPEQLDWLDDVLDTRQRKFIFTHVPPALLKGKLRSPENEVSPQQADYSVYFTEGSDRFGELAVRHRVDRVYMGHIHAMATADVAGVRYVLSGGGGSPLYPLPPGYPNLREAHSISVRVSPGAILETVHLLNGTSITLDWR